MLCEGFFHLFSPIREGGAVMICSFFGHGDSPEFLHPALRDYIECLVEQQKISVFYVGNQGVGKGVERALANALDQKG